MLKVKGYVSDSVSRQIAYFYTAKGLLALKTTDYLDSIRHSPISKYS